MKTQADKGKIFRELHEREGAFIIPNPWDAGSARLLEHLGFEALATTSAGYAFTTGRRDNAVGRDEMMAHVAAVAAATDLPVSADLGNAFGDQPEVVAETFRLVAAAGAVGASVEDATGHDGDPIYELELAIERVRVAVRAARALAFPFTVTARCENYLVGREDIGATVKRLQAYQAAGADVLYAPGIVKDEDIRAVVGSVDRPVNLLLGMAGVQLTLADASRLGVKRVSVGSALCRAAFGAMLRAGREMKNAGTFGFAEQAIPFSEISAIFPK